MDRGISRNRQIGFSGIVALALMGSVATASAQQAPPSPQGPPETLSAPPGALATEPAAPEAPPPGSQGPPARLSFADGNVSFWRPGAQDWAPALVNTPIASGDQLYAGPGANLEMQIAPRAFLRAGAETQLAVDSQEPDYMQLRVTQGHLSLDLRSLPAAHTVEVDTPNAAFTVEHSGYYRVEVKDDSTTFISRRGGRASVTPAGGQDAEIAPSEEVVVSGSDAPQVASYVAPELDAWDHWNYERTDDQIDAVSSRYVSEGVYGADDLDQNGSWRVVPSYGSVWIPSAVPAGWAPYTTGRWMMDPFYGWTWVDAAPWGWAPFHYGRWVHLPGYWAWAPGPVVARPFYAPALVAFFAGGSSGVSLSFGLGTPSVGWVALGWGEPVVPWWGPRGFVGHPRWFGWGGPRVVINQTVVVKNINVYQNVRVENALVTVRGDRFGHGLVEPLHAANPGAHLGPVFGPLPVKANPVSLVGGPDRGVRPPQALLDRRVVATREPEVREPVEVRSARQPGVRTPTVGAPQPQIVPAPRQATSNAEAALRRPPFGQQAGPERALPPPVPRFDDVRQREAAVGSDAGRAVRQPGVSAPQGPAPNGFQPATPGRGNAQQPPPLPSARPTRQALETPPARDAGRLDTQAARQPRAPVASLPNARATGAPRNVRELPGEPANRVYRGPSQPPAQLAPARTGGPSRTEPASHHGKTEPPARSAN